MTLAQEFTVQDYMWSFPQQYGLWSPAEISTALWLDAADVSTITESGGAVSQWDDKSGNGRNATQSTASSRPVYSTAGLNGRNVLTFDGSDDWVGLSASVFSNQLSFSWYAVAARTSSATQSLFTERIVNSNAMVAFLPVDTTSMLNRAGGTSSSSIIEQTETASFPINAAQLLESVQAPTSGTAFRNGTSVATNSATKASLAFRRLVIGGSHNRLTDINPTQQFWAGDVAEIIISLSTHSTDTRQRIEGYLAHKWGLTADLPSDHPYKLVGPTP
jgi:hypothetical protein